MANLTIAIDPETLKKARLRATREGSTVNKLLREFLESYVDARNEQVSAVRNIIALAKKTHSGHVGKRWTRDELYDRRG
jgi:hypothetical protein